MVTDARGHVVPAGSEAPKRQAFLDLSDSINDVRPVADQAGADALVADLVANDIDPTGTTVWLQDVDQVEVYDGTTWHTLPTDESLDGLILKIMSTKPVATDGDTAYPLGWSFMYLTGDDSRAGGWPQAGNFWRVFTYKVAAGNVFQYLTRASPNTNQLLYRNWASGKWSPWTGSGPFAQAAGTATVSGIKAGTSGSTLVTFPTNLFTDAPYITLALYSSIPGERFVSHINKSRTGVTICGGYTGASSNTLDYYVSWNAVQMEGPAQNVALRAARSAPFAFAAEPPEPEPDATVTCPTPGCENEGIPIEVVSTWTDEEGGVHTVGSIECGVCGADITSTLVPIEGS